MDLEGLRARASLPQPSWHLPESISQSPLASHAGAWVCELVPYPCAHPAPDRCEVNNWKLCFSKSYHPSTDSLQKVCLFQEACWLGQNPVLPGSPRCLCPWTSILQARMRPPWDQCPFWPRCGLPAGPCPGHRWGPPVSSHSPGQAGSHKGRQGLPSQLCLVASAGPGSKDGGRAFGFTRWSTGPGILLGKPQLRALRQA